ncbi:MAG: potassium channel protein [Flavobacteriaceae bacterium]|nr:MAG: potassium channel protein [Flavobacteriaceae bacterium]
MNLFKSKLQKAIFLLLVLVGIGIFGYVFLSDYSFVDALYMTVITISTVGFSEIRPLREGDKIFTIFLISTSIFIFGYIVSAFTEYIVSGELFKRLKLKKVQKKIEQLQNHTIICGLGRNGKQAALKLKNYNEQFVIIEKNESIADANEDKDIFIIKGDATIDSVLVRAGIKNAKNLITTLPSDADNLFVVLSASQLNKKCTIISRASDESSYNKLKIAGAENVIMPDKLGGDHMASLVVTPDVIDFVDRLTIAGETTTHLKEISIDDLPHKYIRKTIVDLDMKNKTGCTVIGYKTPQKEYVINPEESTVLVEGSSLIVLGKPEQIYKLKEFF